MDTLLVPSSQRILESSFMFCSDWCTSREERTDVGLEIGKSHLPVAQGDRHELICTVLVYSYYLQPIISALPRDREGFPTAS